MTERSRPGGMFLRTAALAVLTAALATPTLAADHWLSKVRVTQSGGQQIVLKGGETFTVENGGIFAPASGTSDKAVFDLVISLEDNPQGDDDASVDAADDDEQNAYEERIKEFANAVYEMTNGAHKIGKVTVYREFKQQARADVQWELNCASNNGPWAMAGGYLKAGKYIHFCTNWPGAGSLMPSPKGSGYTLAHEWSHYALNVYDEYAADQCQVNLSTLFGVLCPAWQPRTTDQTTRTIMNDQWSAADGTKIGRAHV